MRKQLIVLISLMLLFTVTYAQIDSESSILEKAQTAEDNKDYEMALKW